MDKIKQYKDILDELYNTVQKIDDFQKKAETILELIGDKSSETTNHLEAQRQKLDELKKEINEHLMNYESMFKEMSLSISETFKESINVNIELVKKELESETNELLKKVIQTFSAVYGNLNKDREELLKKLNVSLELQEKEGNVVKDINQQIVNQNQYLSTINNESKANIGKYFESINNIKEELEVLKQNFEVKYVYDRKRIIATSIFSFFMVVMISISIVTSFYMFAYYTRLIFFPNRVHTLIIGILLAFLTIGLIAILGLVIVKPPTFLKTRKGKKDEKHKQK